MRSSTTLRIGATSCAALLLLGCGGSDDDQARPQGTTSTESKPTEEPQGQRSELQDAVRAYSAAFLAGEGEDAYALLSERCQGEMARNDFLDLVNQAPALYGGAEMTSYEDEIDGNVATATYGYSDPAINQTQERWVQEDGAWRNDDC